LDPNTRQDLAVLADYFLHGQAPARTPMADVSYTEAVAQYHAGVPLAYLLGDAAFFDRLVWVSPGVLIPRPETEGLVQAACAYIADASIDQIADVGYGTGCIALEMARRYPNAHIWGWGINPIAQTIAQRNQDRFGASHITWYCQDVFAAIAAGDMIQSGLIISNPPYVNMADPALATQVLAHEPQTALDGGRAGLAWIHQFLQAMAEFQHQGLWFALEIGYDQGPRVRDMMVHYGYEHVCIESDVSGHDRYALGQLR